MQTSQRHNRRLSPFLIMLLALGRVRKGKLPPRYGQTYLKSISTISTSDLRWPPPDRWCFWLIFHRKLSYFYDYLGKIETRGHETGTDPGPRTLLSGFSKTSLIRPRSGIRNFLPRFSSTISFCNSMGKFVGQKNQIMFELFSQIWLLELEGGLLENVPPPSQMVP